MALVLPSRSVCVVVFIIGCLLVVSLRGQYQKQQAQQLEEQLQQHSNRDGQQPLDITVKSQSDLSSSVHHDISSSPRVSATERKRAEKPGVSSTDSLQQSEQEITGVNRDDTDYIVDDSAENVDVAHISSKRQSMTKRDGKSTSISADNVEDRNELNNGERQQRNTILGSINVDSLKNKLDPDDIEVVFPSKEEYLHRYYGINRKGRPNNNQEIKHWKEEQKEEGVISSLDAPDPMTATASLSSKTQGGNSPSYRNGVNAKDEEIIENNREEDLYVFDKQRIDDEIDDYAEDDEYDNMNYAENISKSNGGRVKRRVVRGRDEWANENDYAGSDSRERSKDRHSGGRGRGRTGRGRGSNPNGYDRSSQEMDPDIDPSNYDPDQTEYRAAPGTRRSHQRNGKGGGGGGGGRRTEGDGRGRRAGQDRRYGNRHHDTDGSDRGYSNREDGYTGERSHSASSSPPLSPSRHSDSYGRYSENPAGTRISKSASDKTCHVCAMKKMDREMRLRALKAQIIKQIGLNELPNITKNDRIMSKVPALKYIIENMTMQRDEPSWRDSQGEKSLDITEQMIMTAEKPIHLIGHFGYNLSGLCYFNVSGRLKTSVIKEATLWLYLRPQSKIRRSLVEVRIWDAVDRLVHPDPLKVLKVEIGRFGEWVHVKATSIIKQWVKNTRLNYGLNITAFDSYGNNRIWTPDIPNHAEDYPVMDIKFSPRRHSRHRRTVGQMCTDEEHTGRCCLYPLMVDFLEMKWYWVIYPHHFEANYCSGNCSLDIIDDTIPYAYIGFKSASTIDGVRCCTSTREGELQILYYTDANKIIHTQLEDIVVKECGCR